jgi:hypothetical protein
MPIFNFESAVWGSPRISHVAKPGRNNFAPNLLDYDQSLYTSLPPCPPAPGLLCDPMICYPEAPSANTPEIYKQTAISNLQRLQ